MKHSNAQCKYITLEEVEDAKRRQNTEETELGKKAVSSKISKHLIENVFSHPDVPLYDSTRGIYGMTPPELLHTTQEGLSKQQTDKKAKEVVDNLHHTFHVERGGNNERDFPRSASRTSFFQNTLVQPSERRGNLFILLCISHCQIAQLYFVDALKEVRVDPDEYFHALKLYLAMEDWFHSNNSIEEVKLALQSTYSDDVSFIWYTCAKFCIKDRDVIFRCDSRYGGRTDWYEWCSVRWQIEQGEVSTYPGQILGFFRYETEGIVRDKDQLFVQSSETTLSTADLKSKFVCEFTVDATNQEDLFVVPISSIEDTLFVFKNYGATTKNYFGVLPRRHWSCDFGDRINIYD
ncbi:hypothetical protein ACHAWF_007383 [Thalassiosira exigua]